MEYNDKDKIRGGLKIAVDVICNRLNNTEVIKKIPIDTLLGYSERLLKLLMTMDGIIIEEDESGNEKPKIDEELRLRIKKLLAGK